MGRPYKRSIGPYDPSNLGTGLGNNAITTTSSGVRSTEIRYKPWGTTRYTYRSSPRIPRSSGQAFQYTGQRIESSLGLLFYNARFYDSSLGRFIQADSIVPGGVQGLDRYAYVFNNPLKYIDPSGHLTQSAACGPDGMYCAPNRIGCNNITCSLWHDYGVTLSGDGWTAADMLAIYEGVQATGDKLTSNLPGNKTSGEAYKSVFYTVDFEMYDGQCLEGCWGRSLGANNIRLYRHYTSADGYILNTQISEQLVVHEIGHSFDVAVNSSSGSRPSDALTTNMSENRNGLAGPLWTWQQSKDISKSEIYADMFLGWVYDEWAQPKSEYYNVGVNRQNFMKLYMPHWIAHTMP